MEIRVNNVVRHYDGVDAINDVSLTVQSNKIIGIIGRSGAGKSTLVRLMSLLERPDSGEVWFGGERVDNLDKDALTSRRRRIGMIFQNFNLFSSRNAGGNVAYPLEINGVPKEKILPKVRSLLSLVGLEDKIYAPISTLSGGQKQRVSIARALATDPEILFCDEATSALDPQTTRSILSLIKEVQAKMNLTVVMITHQMEVVRDTCDYVYVLEAGKVVEHNTTQGLFSSPKTPLVKDFLANLAPSGPEGGMLLFSGDKGHYILRFAPGATGKPILSHLIKKYSIDMNILGAGIQTIDGESYGTMECDITGDPDSLREMFEDLKKENVKVEEAGK